MLLSHDENIITAEEYFLLNDLNTSKNLDFPYWLHNSSELDLLTDAACKSESRFYRNDIYKLAEVLNIPDEIVCHNRPKFDGIEAFCIFLKGFASPRRYSDIIQRCGRFVPELCLMSNAILNKIFDDHFHLLRDFQQIWLSPPNLELFSEKVHTKGAALDNCWEFLDGTVRPVCRPTKNSGLSLLLMDLLQICTAQLKEKNHDSAMLTMSNLNNQLVQYSRKADGEAQCIYGDPAYPIRPQLQGPFKSEHCEK